MALSDEEKKEITELIRQELSNFMEGIRNAFTGASSNSFAGSSSKGIEVRSAGTPLSGSKRAPLAADQCCNGCD